MSLTTVVRPFFSIHDYHRCIDTMRTLTAKYAGGYEDWASQMGEEPVVRSVSRMQQSENSVGETGEWEGVEALNDLKVME